MSGSSDLSPDFAELPEAPLVSSLFQDDHPLTSEQIDIGMFQRDGQTVFGLVTIPVPIRIKSVQGLTPEQTVVLQQEQVISIYGRTEGSSLEPDMEFLPGDYCMGLSFSSIEQAETVSHIRLVVETIVLSNFQLAQIFFGMYRSLGFEPSHVLKYAARSSSSGTPFYRKTRSDVDRAKSELKTDFKEEMGLIKDDLKLIKDELGLVKTSFQSNRSSDTASQDPAKLERIQGDLSSLVQSLQMVQSGLTQLQQSLTLSPAPLSQTQTQGQAEDKKEESLSDFKEVLTKIHNTQDDLSRNYTKLSEEYTKLTENYTKLTENYTVLSEKVSELTQTVHHNEQSRVELINSGVVQKLEHLDHLCQEIHSAPLAKIEHCEQIKGQLDCVQTSLNDLSTRSSLQESTPVRSSPESPPSSLSLSPSPEIAKDSLTLSLDQTYQALLRLETSSNQHWDQVIQSVSKLEEMNRSKVSSESVNLVDREPLQRIQTELLEISKGLSGISVQPLNEKLEELKKMLGEIVASDKKMVQVDELQRLIIERKNFYEQLQTAEDYIENYLSGSYPVKPAPPKKGRASPKSNRDRRQHTH